MKIDLLPSITKQPPDYIIRYTINRLFALDLKNFIATVNFILAIRRGEKQSVKEDLGVRNSSSKTWGGGKRRILSLKESRNIC